MVDVGGKFGLILERWGMIMLDLKSGDCTTVATQPRQLHYSNNLSKKKGGGENNKKRSKA